MLWGRLPLRTRCTTLCNKVCQWLATGRWFSPDIPVSSTNKTDHHDITEMLFKVALNAIKPTQSEITFQVDSDQRGITLMILCEIFTNSCLHLFNLYWISSMFRCLKVKTGSIIFFSFVLFGFCLVFFFFFFSFSTYQCMFLFISEDISQVP
jgi:hypothetical protein